MNKSSDTFKRVLVANRGEIAVRIIRSARALGIESVALYTPADEGTLPVRLADRAVSLGESTASKSYLHQEKIILAAIQSGADCVHPGYGFFAENADFAEALSEEGIRLIGPSPTVMRQMGSKDSARTIAVSAGLPVVPGESAPKDFTELKKLCKKIGYPLLLKAVAGGSGRGMRMVEAESELLLRLEEAKKEALGAFGNDEMLIEKYIQSPRHIEVQVFADRHGNVVHVGERDCSTQRRHQKLLEEAPAAKLHPTLRSKLHQASIELCKKVGYEGAGTIEYLVENSASEKGTFYFLEMNTRIQVEHPVTEAVFGVDLLAEQFRVAAGYPLSFSQDQLVPSGHAIEFRIYAEDPSNDFKPATGTIRYLSRIGGLGVREDTWAESGSTISPYYDSLISKLIISGATRDEAIERARATLAEFVVDGVPSTLGFHRWLLSQPDFLDANIDVAWISRKYQGETIQGENVGPLRVPPLPEFAPTTKGKKSK